MYFAWLGYYTSCLIPLALVGFICFMYGFSTFYSDEAMRDVCFRDPFVKTNICRTCAHEQACSFTRIDDYCVSSIANAIIVNQYTTIPWAFMLCIWSVLFLESSKRYQARMACKWGTSDLERVSVMYSALVKEGI